MEYLNEKLSDNFLELNICGKQKIERDITTIRPNGRCDYHLLYILTGVCYLENYLAHPGDLVLFHPNERQYYRFYGKDKTESLYFHFSGTGCEKLLKTARITKRVNSIGKIDKLMSIYKYMNEEYLIKQEGYKVCCAGLLAQFITIAGRGLTNNSPSYPNRELINVLDKMNKNFQKNLPVSYYAELCNLSESRFCHVMREHTGMSPKAYLTMLKVEYALKLIETSDLSLSEISEETGIDDYNYFCRLIRTKTGKSPSQHRKS